MISKRDAILPKEVQDSCWLPLSRNLFALIDDEDKERASKWLWSAFVRKEPYSPYALRRQDNRTIYLHRFIMNAPGGMDVDHIDGNGLNCKKSNLRICTHAQNQYNYRKCVTATSSIYKGVRFDGKRNSWLSVIKKDRRTINLGRHDSEEVAALAYDKAAIRLFGQYARPNLMRAEEITR